MIHRPSGQASYSVTWYSLFESSPEREGNFYLPWVKINSGLLVSAYKGRHHGSLNLVIYKYVSLFLVTAVK